MTDDQFKLVGHDNPLGRYPGPVVPVGRLNGALVAVYAGDSKPEIVELNEAEEYVTHNPLVGASLAHFDYRRERLFAFGEQEVAHYPVELEAIYFNELLKDDHFSLFNPFLRLSLAKATDNVDQVLEELSACAAHVWRTASEELVDSWYSQEREVVLKSINSKQHFRVPRTWKTLPRFRRPLNVSVTTPTPNFYGQLSSGASHSWKGASTGTARAAALMVMALYRDRVGAEFAYRTLLDRNYDTQEINLMMTEQTCNRLFSISELKVGYPERTNLADLLRDRTHIKLSDSHLVCAGSYAMKLAGVSEEQRNGDLVRGLIASGLQETLARDFELEIKKGCLLIGVSSRSTNDATYFFHEWQKK